MVPKCSFDLLTASLPEPKRKTQETKPQRIMHIYLYIYIYIFTYTYIHIALKVRILVFEYYLKHVTIDLPTKTTHQPPAADSPCVFLLFGFSRPRYQANHLGFCPPNLCNATTSPESRAWQYLELLGHRSNETMKVLGKIIGEVGGFCFFVCFLFDF